MCELKKVFIWLLVICQLSFAKDEKNEETWFSWQSCPEILKKVGVAKVIAGVIGVGVLWAWSRQEANKKKKVVPTKITYNIPKGAEIKLADLQGDRDLYLRVSDLADYLLQKYQKDLRLTRSLEKFTQNFPEESQAALMARFPKEFQRNGNPTLTLNELGPSAHYVLVFAWILREVYNEDVGKSDRTLKNVVQDIEKKIEQVGTRDR